MKFLKPCGLLVVICQINLVQAQEADSTIRYNDILIIVLTEDAFVLLTPIYDLKDLKDEREDEFILEIESVFDIAKDQYQVGWFYRGAFQSEIHTFRVFFTVFL